MYEFHAVEAIEDAVKAMCWWSVTDLESRLFFFNNLGWIGDLGYQIASAHY